MKKSGAVVWHLCSNRWYSAVTGYALTVARVLDQAGFVNVFSSLPTSPGHAHAKKLGLWTEPMKDFGLFGLRQYQALSRQIKPDYLIVYGGPEATLVSLGRRFPGCKVIRFRGQDSDDIPTVKHLLARVQSTDAVLTPSLKLAAYWRGVVRCPVGSVAFGADEHEFFPEPWQRERSDRPVFLIVGRLDPIKGHREFLPLFAKIIADWPVGEPKPVLKIVGQQANLSAEEILNTAMALGLRIGLDIEVVSSRISNMREMMNQARLGVITSLGSEAICRVGAEFLLCGTPLLVSSAGALSELLFDGAGLNYTTEEYQTLVRFCLDRCHDSFDDRSLRASRARARFSLTSMQTNLLATLKLNGPASTNPLST